MKLHFCPQCGSGLQPGFKFCPSCGEKLPCAVDSVESAECPVSPSTKPANADSVQGSSSPDLKTKTPAGGKIGGGASPSSVLARSPARATRRTVCKSPSKAATPKSTPTPSDQKSLTSPQKRKAPSQETQEEEPKKETAPSPRTPPSVKGKAKKAKQVCAVEEGVEFTDQAGSKWKLEKLLNETETEFTYAVSKVGAKSSVQKHILRLGAKDGQLFNEQNFHQRAAKPAVVEKWVKKQNLDFLGIPSCVGFGLHETYRFLIFPDMGQSLQSVIDEGLGILPVKTVLQVSLRILDVLKYIHENEYAHANIHSGNIFVNQTANTQVYLSGFGHAFRFCPGGEHVEYREGGRTPHQGNASFISLDSHKGVGPSRRSDLHSLGYCMLSWMTGALPWNDTTQTITAVAAEKERYMNDVSGLLRDCFKRKKVSDVLKGYLSHVMGLQYSEKPNYELLTSVLSDALEKMGESLEEPLSF
ncbi:serine/threonine-protein kinase VRK3 [Chanos chanos]|uniref:Serine/threonine-protein kinase VRK3 n=1 Tax=Chanos chanos TaxID=29144 RepID=A0A6J2URT5_CHACN|nr:inactive serine/threonine-protein kinase VRK3 [Chanos chanos]